MKLEQAKQFLREELAAGPVEGRLVTQRAGDAGISSRTLRRAREALSVNYVRSGIGEPTLWALSADTPALDSAEEGVEILPARPSGVSDRETIKREISRVYSNPQGLWDALERHRGLLGPTAETLGVSREALEFMRDADENVAELIRRAVERALDTTIAKLWQVADEGHVPALGRLLQATAAHRGFGVGGGRAGSDELVDVSLTFATSYAGVGESITLQMPRAEADALPDSVAMDLTARGRLDIYGHDSGHDDGGDSGHGAPRDHDDHGDAAIT